MTGRVIVADAEFIKPDSLPVIVLEQSLADFAERYELGWGLRIVGSVAIVHLVAPYRMGDANLRIFLFRVLMQVAQMGTNPLRFSEKVGA
jgi:hypothetical protein